MTASEIKRIAIERKAERKRTAIQATIKRTTYIWEGIPETPLCQIPFMTTCCKCPFV